MHAWYATGKIGVPVVLFSLLAAGTPEAGPVAHREGTDINDACGACHRGHGAPGTPMLPEPTDKLCMGCHGGGDAALKNKVLRQKRDKLRDVGRDFAKPYRHPVETGELHRRGERLPEPDPNAPRHVSCLDCHDAHNTLAEVRSRFARRLYTSPVKSTLRDEPLEYRLCYRCHGYSANLPAESRNVAEEFNPANRSFHPVESVGKGDDIVSLKSPLSRSSVIACSDCHGGDDDESWFAQHGSSYPYLLHENFSTADGVPESEPAYRLCYRCHERSSILSDKSFAQHSRHLRSPGAATSCRTCHNPHGSRDFPHLIDFSPAVVRPTSEGTLDYRKTGPRSGECWLSCHGVEHSPGRYCPPEQMCPPGRVVPSGKGMIRRPTPLSPIGPPRRLGGGG